MTGLELRRMRSSNPFFIRSMLSTMKIEVVEVDKADVFQSLFHQVNAFYASTVWPRYPREHGHRFQSLFHQVNAFYGS